MLGYELRTVTHTGCGIRTIQSLSTRVKYLSVRYRSWSPILPTLHVDPVSSTTHCLRTPVLQGPNAPPTLHDSYLLHAAQSLLRS